MKSNIDYVVHSALKQDKVINALYYPFDGWYENFCIDGTNKYYLIENSGVYEWQLKQYPDHFTIIPESQKSIPNRIDLDMIITNHRIEQLEKVKRVSDNCHLPLILIEHNLPIVKSSPEIRKYINFRIPQNVHHVVTHEFLRDEWCLENVTVLPYGIPSHKTTNERKKDVVVIGDYNPEDHPLLQTMLNSYHSVSAYGNNPGFTKPYVSIDYLISQLQTHKVCLIATNDNKPPLLQLLAMANGAVVITNKNRWTDKFIQHEHNGLLFSKDNDIKKLVRYVLDNPSETERLVANGYDFIEEHHSVEKNSLLMNNYLNSILGEVYLR